MRNLNEFHEIVDILGIKLSREVLNSLVKILHQWILMMPESSPVRCTILALVTVTCKREQHRNTFKGHRCGAGQTPSEG